MTHFKNLHLNEKILNALEKKGYTTPTDIQNQAIPHVLEGRDLLGIAQTGTGKTAAFSLPLLHNLAKNPVSVKSGGVRALILTPTRELASQIADNIELYGKDLGLKYAVMFGGVSEKPQIAATQGGVDILIATPGRLLDLTSQGYIRYMQLEVLILDEADRMLDMGFINDVKKIIAKIPPKRQTLFFSATMPASVAGLADSILTNPVKVEVTPQSTTVEKIAQKVLFVDKSHKLSLLKKTLNDENLTSALVFCKTKHGANKVVEFLTKNSISVAAIHGNKSQGAREKALLSFREGKIKVLVATDIAARGIDIPAISHIINYDIPVDPESYVHRIGRTARAGRNGIAMSFCDPSEIKYLREVEKAIKVKIPVDDEHAFQGVEPAPQSSFSSEPRRHNAGGRSQEPRRSYAGGSSREPRKYGFAVNKARKISENQAEGRSDDRRGNTRPHGRDSFKKDEPRGGKKILGFFGFGKKDSNSDDRRKPSFNDDRRPRGNSTEDKPRRDYRPDFKPRGDSRPDFRERPKGNFGDDRRSDFRGERKPRTDSDFRGERKPRTDFNSDNRKDDGKKKSFGFGWFKSKKDEGSSSFGRPARPDGRRSSGEGFKGGNGARRPYSSNSGARKPSFNGNRSGGNFGGKRTSS